MNVNEAKVELARKVLATNDEELLNYISTIFSSQDDWWNSLPENVQAAVNRGLSQSEQKKTKPHSQVMKKYEKLLNK